MAKVNRRDALKGLGAAVASPLVATGCDLGETPPDPLPEVTPELIRERIDTVVFLVMENRSFDHFFGALSLAEGRTDVDGLVEGMSNPRPDGEEVAVFPAERDCVADPPHSWNASHNQFNDGANDGFVAEHDARHGAGEAHRVMGYFDRERLPASYALADRFTVCDRWFCSVMSSTWPNRFYALAATSGGMTRNDPPPGDFPSIFDRLDAAGRTWRDYFSNAPFSILLPTMTFDEEKFSPLDEFFRDAEFGILPNFSFIEPFYGRNSDHPPEHPLAGQVLIASIYEALARSPQWERCMLVITYDEHGGWFDHVPPPLMADERADEGFDRPGFRVPSLVIGPWVKEAHTSSTVFDHTSMLAFLETLWDMPPLSERDAAANNLMDVLDEDRLAANQPSDGPTLPVLEVDEEEIYAEDCVGDLFRSEGEPVPMSTQPELNAWLDEHHLGAPFDLRAETEERFAALLDKARELGVLRFT